MLDTATATPTPAEQLKALQGEADALAKQQAAAAADATTMQKAFEDGEREIAAYLAEHDQLENDTDEAKHQLQAIVDRIKHHSATVAAKVGEIIKTYDDAVGKIDYKRAADKAETAGEALKEAEKDAERKQADFEKNKGRRDRLKLQLGNLQNTVRAADARDDAGAYAEAYALAAPYTPATATEAVPTVTVFATDLRNAWEALRDSRRVLREKNDAYFRAVRKRDDLEATIAERKAKRADNIRTQVIETQTNGEESGDTTGDSGPV